MSTCARESISGLRRAYLNPTFSYFSKISCIFPFFYNLSCLFRQHSMFADILHLYLPQTSQDTTVTLVRPLSANIRRARVEMIESSAAAKTRHSSSHILVQPRGSYRPCCHFQSVYGESNINRARTANPRFLGSDCLRHIP